MAADMRAVIKSALRLPFDEDRIVEILREGEGRAAADPNDEDHTHLLARVWVERLDGRWLSSYSS